MVRNMASRRTEKTHSPDEELANGIVVVLLPRGTGCSSQLATKHMSARRVLNEAHAEGHCCGPRRGAGPLGRREQPHTEIHKKNTHEGCKKKKLGNAAGQARVMPLAPGRRDGRVPCEPWLASSGDGVGRGGAVAFKLEARRPSGH